MAKKTILSDFENKFFDDFDRFVKFTYTQLCTDVNYGGVSPAYTGYFASSWQVASSGYIKREAPEVSQKRRSKDFPWREVYEDNWRARNAGAPYTRARIAQKTSPSVRLVPVKTMQRVTRGPMLIYTVPMWLVDCPLGLGTTSSPSSATIEPRVISVIAPKDSKVK